MRELVREALKLNNKFDQLRGYDSGIRAKHLEKFSDETLKELIGEMESQIKTMSKDNNVCV